MSSHRTRQSEITALLETAPRGDTTIVDRLVPLIYDQLRAIARRQLDGEPPDRTLQTTALVHEAYLKLVAYPTVTSHGRAYFFAAAAKAMRQVLVEHARKRRAAKRGGGAKLLTLGEGDAAIDAYAIEMLELDQALSRLAERSPRQAQTVECRFFGGMSVRETAEALGVSTRTVESDWAMARAWLFDTLSGGGGPPEEAGP